MTGPASSDTSSARTWSAPYAGAPVCGAVRVPGSKSLTNRALVLAALARSSSRVQAPLRARDTALMTDALRVLGVGIVDDGPDWVVTPGPLRGAAHVDVGLAGTVMRFLPPLAGLVNGDVSFDGDARARERPLQPMLAALRSLGVEVDDGGRGGLPLTVRGTGRVTGGSADIDASGPSQLVSGLLLTAPRFDAGVHLRHVGGRLPSGPHIAMTVTMLRQAGALVDDSTPLVWRVEPGELSGRTWRIEPDLSSAAPFLAAAAATGGSVTLTGWPPESAQPGAQTLEVLAAMGASYTIDDGGVTVSGGAHLTGIDVDLADNPELTPVLAVLAALADSPSRLRGVAHLRGQETDRLAALAREIEKLGGQVTITDDGLTIQPRPLHGGVFETYDDHRLVMAAAVLALRVPGLAVANPATVAKTMPDFVGRWTALVQPALRSAVPKTRRPHHPPVQ